MVLDTVTASTKRNTDLGGGKHGAAVAHLTSLVITPLYPAASAIVQRLGFTGAQLREMKECFHLPVVGAAMPDVRERDILTVAGVDYPIAYVAEWPDSILPSLHIVVGEVKSQP